eukprot:CAMPEP_0204402264 /NCGR_PEP_ID=MMETSP0470-20130426/5206_1 /ASSEMBLY_ACC=CAM_ASM_000385 /TAXON_ID=2969 /ORGANISM="Oxyrrhis marina" /LENGTH=100 /DNA_ID=CAMNT_0051397343 /DNA_START=217 /DNA_END=517 /DNA_ORIENTATION=+
MARAGSAGWAWADVVLLAVASVPAQGGALAGAGGSGAGRGGGSQPGGSHQPQRSEDPAGPTPIFRLAPRGTAAHHALSCLCEDLVSSTGAPPSPGERTPA